MANCKLCLGCIKDEWDVLDIGDTVLIVNPKDCETPRNHNKR